ncbi:LiaF domain-containing protein [Chitinophaga sp. Cy-1792]|uniref:LiaF transmembrane domain-containing protein n=1 Tax=Chitinophaga sp. Cy-1792 TaxID=2608339 RepID=UPI0014246AD2|nr:LiaF domain-containing protein [Chitinophaga sp. Cy-1792]NIG53479.1 hypothetical protein [Chitinophaga sp. Cy-1792]
MTNSETEIKKADKPRRRNGLGGIIFILIGAALLLRQFALDLPYWLFSWQMLLIVIGLLVGIKHNFRGGGWLILILIGGVFLAGEILAWPYNTARFIWPVVLIIIGMVTILKRNDDNWWHHRHEKRYWKNYYKEQYGKADYSGYVAPEHSGENFSDDVINSSAIFSGVNKLVLSKNFKGGYVSSIFGGMDLNLTQADIQGTAVLDVSAIFGGCEIVVPSNWVVKTDVTTVMGGIEDKRSPELMRVAAADKTLLIKGSCIFGGIEIKSYI